MTVQDEFGQQQKTTYSEISTHQKKKKISACLKVNSAQYTVNQL